MAIQISHGLTARGVPKVYVMTDVCAERLEFHAGLLKAACISAAASSSGLSDRKTEWNCSRPKGTWRPFLVKTGNTRCDSLPSISCEAKTGSGAGRATDPRGGRDSLEAGKSAPYWHLQGFVHQSGGV